MANPAIDSNADAVLADYMRRSDAGETIDREAFVAAHPQVAEELREYFASVDDVERMAGPPLASTVKNGIKAAETHVSSVGDSVSEKPARRTQSANFASADSLPETFGRYRIEKRLGRGAMGAVYLAQDTQLDRRVALKTPTFDTDADADMVERFYREARAAANLRHAGICPIFDVGKIDDTHYISMAYIEGKPMSALVDVDKPIPIRSVVSLVRKIALALDHAHSQGVIHRDLKPANIMIDKQKQPLIMDFGLARRVDKHEQTRLTQDGMILGTPAYMSPEQVQGDLESGKQSDVYSLGVILYELLTGDLPFQGTVAAVIGQIMTQDAPPPSGERPEIDPPLDAICQKMMARKIEDRYAGTKEAADALTGYLKGNTSRSPASLRSRASRTPAMQTVTADEGLAAFLETASKEEFPAVRTRRDGTLTQIVAPWKKLPSRTKVIATSALAGVLLLGVIILVRAPEGTVQVEVAGNEDIDVLIDGDKIQLTDGEWKAKKPARRHTLGIKIAGATVPFDIDSKSFVFSDGAVSVKIGDVAISSQEFEVVRGKNVVLRIEVISEDPNHGNDRDSQSPNVTADWKNVAIGPPPSATAPFDSDTAKRHQEAWADYLGLEAEREFKLPNGARLRMVLIPPGEFLMGSDDEVRSKLVQRSVWTRVVPKEGPQHRVRVTRPYYLGKFEVTQAQWQAVMNGNPSSVRKPTMPVTDVSWLNADMFVKAVNEQSGQRQFRFVLPSEAQWEYACRAGTTTLWYCGDDDTKLKDFSWFQKGSVPHPVGKLLPNAFGLHDMHGNVFEWCMDWYDGEYYAKSPAQDPTGPETGSNRVCRSGNVFYQPEACRSALRLGRTPGYSADGTGFRLAAAITGDFEQLFKRLQDRRRAGDADDAPHLTMEPPQLISQFEHDGTTRRQCYLSHLSADAGRVAYRMQWKASMQMFETTSRKVVPLPELLQTATTIDENADGSLLAAGHTDGTVRLWNSRTLEPVGQPFVTTSGFFVRWVSLSDDGKTLLALPSGQPPKFYAWDVESREPITEPFVLGDDNKVKGIHAAASADNRLLAVAYYEKDEDSKHFVELWDVKTGQPRSTLFEPNQGSLGTIYGIDLSPSGDRLAVASRNGSCFVFDTATGKHTLSTSHGGRVFSARFSPDGRQLATCGGPADSEDMHLWDLESGEELVRWSLPTRSESRRADQYGAQTSFLVYSRDGSQLLTAGVNTPVCVWSLKPTSQTAAKTNAPTEFSRLFTHPGGYFIQGRDKDWFQKWDNGGKPLNQFREIDRTAEYVELRHRLVRVTFRLYGDRSEIKDERKPRARFVKRDGGEWVTPTAVTDTSRSLWVQPHGYFLRGPGKDWIESWDDGKKEPNLFEEVQRTDEFVELKHRSLTVLFRLYADRALGKSARRNENDFVLRYTGSWQNSLVGGTAPASPQLNDSSPSETNEDSTNTQVPPELQQQLKKLEEAIFPSLVYVQAEGDKRKPLAVATAKGICCVYPGGFENVEISTLDLKQKFAGTVGSRGPFPFCWIDPAMPRAGGMPLAAASAHRKAQPGVIVMREDGSPVLQTGTVNADGTFTPVKPYSPPNRGVAAPGPIFDANGQCLGYGVRLKAGQPIKIYPLQRQ